MRRLYLLASMYLAIAGFLLTGEALALFSRAEATRPVRRAEEPADASTPYGWFTAVKANCNSLEAAITIQRNPPPESAEGSGYAAACYALGGRFEQARDPVIPTRFLRKIQNRRRCF